MIKKKCLNPFPYKILILCSQNYALSRFSMKIPTELYDVKQPKKQ
jgi:hypothetical protein